MEIYELPQGIKGMKTLDKSAFRKICKVSALKLHCKDISKVKTKILKKRMLKIQKVKPVIELDDNDPDKNTHKLILFKPEITTADDFTQEEKSIFKGNDIHYEKLEFYDLELSFDNLSAKEVIRAILPDDIIDSVSGFSIIGHIAHLNLKREVLDYKHIIGEVILDKNSHSGIRTVINKLDSIDNTYRNFQMELLAGEEDYVTVSKENDCSFQFDFSKVYWNTRLVGEHRYIVDLLEKTDVLYDVFAGVGPFSIPAAKKGVTVLANDLNPDSYKALNDNITLNKVKPDKIQTFNMDGRDFICNVVKQDFKKRLENQDCENEFHLTMNLPALAIEFMDAFKDLFKDEEIAIAPEKLPVVHCYCFTKDTENAEKDVIERAESIIGMKLPAECKVRYVRNVAPNKEMMCIKFRLFPELVSLVTGR
ncbi:hypothetical protein LOTGIDRAFT_110690 [Lottia gigantea]|uniref:tRNA (guanine(37)-N1)-methyltransferase n=1 Tax=Lottia gigantea TaxID=225164 RepID=V4CL06_LOTGI|nr:hypothetical protein LOTGIDRAFT_110690 [Lottia gigantea]ESP02935.1 hypothetical protein LOTGIDRAFT_110690 [Lottia gigantea]